MSHIHEFYDFTVSAFILHPDERKICLHYHKRLNFWLQVGGHVETNEDLIQALTRELEEEAGLKSSDYEIIQLHKQPITRGTTVMPIPFHIDVHDITKTHKHIDLVYVVKSSVTALKPKAGESMQIGWYSLKQTKELHDTNVMPDSIFDMCKWVFKNYL